MAVIVHKIEAAAVGWAALEAETVVENADKKRLTLLVSLLVSWLWRRRRDSNPRWNLRPTNDLANRPLQPLGYPSATLLDIIKILTEANYITK